MGSVLCIVMAMHPGFLDAGQWNSVLAAPPGSTWSEGADQQILFDERLVGLPALDRKGTGLVRYLRSLTLTEDDRRRVRERIEFLGSDDFRHRAEAMQRLLEEKGAVLGLLRQAVKDTDLERKRRLELCLSQLGQREKASRTEAALRLLPHYRPAGATAAVLAYLPCAGDDFLTDQALAVLLELGLADPSAASVLQEALSSPQPLTRGGAALVLGFHGNSFQKDLARKLCADNNPQVGLHATLGLAAHGGTFVTPIPVRGLHSPLTPWWKSAHFLNYLPNLQNNPHLLVEVLNPNRRSNRLAQLFFDAMAAGRGEDMQKITTVPFFLGGILTLQTREEFDRVFRPVLQENEIHPKKVHIVLQYGMRGEDYLPLAPELEQIFLAEHDLAQVRVVLVQGTVGQGKEEKGAVLIKFHDGDLRVIGIGHVD